MARVQYGAIITAIEGSIGGFTFQKNRSGEIVRSRPKTYKNSTPKQTIVQSFHMNFLVRWQNLSLANKILWNDFADLHLKTNAFGEIKKLSGLNWYESINQNRQQMNLGILDSPRVHALPTAPPAYTVTIDDVTLEIEFDPAFTPVDTDLKIWTTQPVSNVSVNLRNAFRLTKLVTGDNYGIIDLISDWETTHSIPWPPSSQTSCFQIGIMVQSCLQASGICSVGVLNIDNLDVPITGIGFMEIGTTFVVS